MRMLHLFKVIEHNPFSTMCLLLFVAQMLKKITTEETLEDRPTAELDALKHRDWVRGKE